MSTQTRCRANLFSEHLWLTICAVLALLVACPYGATAQGDEIAPPKSMEGSGVPKVPSSLAKEVKRYLGAYGLPLAGWHPEKRELWVKGISSAAWIARVEVPGSSQKTWAYLPFGDVYDVYFQPQAKYLIYNRDANGDELFQMFLYNLATRASTLLSEEKSRNTEPVWSHSGERVVWSFSPSKGRGVSLSVINPLDPKSRRLLVESTGNYLKAYGWSPDDAQVAFCEFIGNNTSRLWLVDVEKGEIEWPVGKRFVVPRTVRIKRVSHQCPSRSLRFGANDGVKNRIWFLPNDGECKELFLKHICNCIN